MTFKYFFQLFFNSRFKKSLAVLSGILLFCLSMETAVGQQKQNNYPTLQKQASINLAQTIKIALANNLKVKQALLSLKSSDQQVRKAWGNVYPEISGSASYTRNLELPVFFFPADPTDPNSPLRPITVGADNNWQAGLTISQTIFDGAVFVGVSSAEVFKAVQAASMRATAQQTVTQTRLAYNNVLIAEAQLRLAKESLQRLLENLEVNKARLKAGLIDQYAVLQVKVQVSNQKPAVTAAKYDVQQAYRKLKLVMGVPVNMPISIKGNLGKYDILTSGIKAVVNKNLKTVNTSNPYAFRTDTTLITVAKEFRGDIRVLNERNKLKVKEIKAAKAEFLPTLSASYNLNYTAQEPGSINLFGTRQNRVRTQSVMLTLSVPIFDGFRRSATVQVNQIEKKDLEIQKRMAIREAKNEIKTARENLNQALETASARTKALKQAREGYERALSRLENGLGSQLEATEAEFQLQQAQLNYAQMVYNYLSAKARYDMALGVVPFVNETEPEMN